MTPTGLDFGNTRIKICIDDKSVSIPSLYAFDKPIITNSAGKEVAANCFSLLFKKEDGTDFPLYFGQDTLASHDTIGRIDMAKYDPAYISFLFRAALYAWSKKHSTDISTLGKLEIVASMPPGIYRENSKRLQAERAYRNAFNRGQSHIKIRDGKSCIQVVTQFKSLIRECVAFGQDVPRKNELVLVFDLGGGTNDIALFNGSSQPLQTWTKNTGLIHTFERINPASPRDAELKILRGDRAIPALISYYNDVENLIQLVKRNLPKEVSKIYIIGGGASLMPKSAQKIIRSLASKVIIKDEFSNAEANWKEASK